MNPEEYVIVAVSEYDPEHVYNDIYVGKRVAIEDIHGPEQVLWIADYFHTDTYVYLYKGFVFLKDDKQTRVYFKRVYLDKPLEGE